MKKVLVLAAVGEAATGAALLIVPSLVGQMLFGENLTGIAVTVARVTGIALIALAVACWLGTPLIGMLTYSAAVTLYLAYVGFVDSSTGILLWPAVGLHVILTALLTRAWRSDEETKTLGVAEVVVPPVGAGPNQALQQTGPVSRLFEV